MKEGTGSRSGRRPGMLSPPSSAVVFAAALLQLVASVHFLNDECQLRCSPHVNCSVSLRPCHFFPDEEYGDTHTKQIPSAPTNLRLSFENNTWGSYLLRAEWGLPSDGSFTYVTGYRVDVRYNQYPKGLWDSGRCYTVVPSVEIRDIHSTSKESPSLYMDCVSFFGNESVGFEVNVTSLPRNPHNPKTISNAIEHYIKDQKWHPGFEIYSGGLSGLHLLMRPNTGGDTWHYRMTVKTGHTELFREIYSVENKNNCPENSSSPDDLCFIYRMEESEQSTFHKDPMYKCTLASLIPEGFCYAFVPYQFLEDNDYKIAVEPLKKDFGIVDLKYRSSDIFKHGDLQLWGPAWDPRVEAFQTNPATLFGESDTISTHLILDNPWPSAACYSLSVYQEPEKSTPRKLVFKQMFAKNDNTKLFGDLLVTDFDGQPQLLVPGLEIGRNYTFSLDALDELRTRITNVQRVKYAPLPIGIKNITVKAQAVISHAKDNRLAIIIGLAVPAVLVIAFVCVCFIWRGRTTCETWGCTGKSRSSRWWLNNAQSMHGIKVIPIYCWENDLYEKAVKLHVNLLQQYACMQSSPSSSAQSFGKTPLSSCRWRCLSSLIMRLAKTSSRSTKDTVAEMKISEVVIYLSPRLAHLMSAGSAPGQNIYRRDNECIQLLSSLWTVLRSGHSRQPHLVTFDLWNKAEIPCVEVYQKMMMTASRSGATRYDTLTDTVTLPTSAWGCQGQSQVVVSDGRAISSEHDSPLVLTMQISGALRLHNFRELVAKLQGVLDFPNSQNPYHHHHHHHHHQHLQPVSESWRESNHVQELEEILTQIAGQGFLPLALEDPTSVKVAESDAQATDPNSCTPNFSNNSDAEKGGAVLCVSLHAPEKHPSVSCFSHSGSPRSTLHADEESDAKCKSEDLSPDSEWCTSCGKLRSDSSEKMGNATHCHGSGECEATAVCLPTDPLLEWSGEPDANTPNSPSSSSYHKANKVSNRYVLENGYNNYKNSQTNSKFQQRKLDPSILRGAPSVSSCHELGLRQESSFSPSFNHPTSVTRHVVPLEQGYGYPAAFSQEVIPPDDQCRGATGSTLEMMARQFNADSGWSEEDISTVGIKDN